MAIKCDTCVLVVSKVLLYNKIVLPVQISINYSITHCNSVIRVGNSGRCLLGDREMSVVLGIVVMTQWYNDLPLPSASS